MRGAPREWEIECIEGIAPIIRVTISPQKDEERNEADTERKQGKGNACVGGPKGGERQGGGECDRGRRGRRKKVKEEKRRRGGGEKRGEGTGKEHWEDEAGGRGKVKGGDPMDLEE